MSNVIVDVGANSGSFALALAARNPTMTVFAIEPVPNLANQIEAKAEAEGLSNLVCLRVAIDEVPRQAVFHVSSEYDQGISSLLDFDSKSITADDYWRGRPDLQFTDDIDVRVERMEQALPWSSIDRVSFVKIDAQGCDMAVLRSFGTTLARVDAGMLEVPTLRILRLYRDEDTDLAAAIQQLNALGFDVYAVKPNDHATNECNIFFHRRGTDWRAMEAALSLRGVDLYDGKHYWHLPASQMMHHEANLAGLHAALTAVRAEAALSRDRLAGAFAAAVTAQQDAAAARAEAERQATMATRQQQAWATQETEFRRQQQAAASEIDALRRSLTQVLGSYSMRLTHPLRALHGLRRRLAGAPPSTRNPPGP